MLYGLIVVAILLLGSILFVASSYNTLVMLRNRLLNAFAQIEVQLKRRHDLIPNLVEAVKGAMAHERQTLEAVIAARNAAVTATDAAAHDPSSPLAMNVLISAEGALGAALGRFRLLSEAYPDLKTSQNTASLMEELSSTENRIAFARQAYNDSVMTYNTKRQTFPTNLLAAPFGFAAATLFEIADPAERQSVQVKLS